MVSVGSASKYRDRNLEEVVSRDLHGHLHVPVYHARHARDT